MNSHAFLQYKMLFESAPEYLLRTFGHYTKSIGNIIRYSILAVNPNVLSKMYCSIEATIFPIFSYELVSMAKAKFIAVLIVALTMLLQLNSKKMA
jgi:hypothetical protein